MIKQSILELLCSPWLHWMQFELKQMPSRWLQPISLDWVYPYSPAKEINDNIDGYDVAFKNSFSRIISHKDCGEIFDQ